MSISFLQNIFSVKNEKRKYHKVVTLFGVKIKIRDYYEEISHKKIDKKFQNFKKIGISKTNRTPKVIVSLTSYPERMNEIHYTIYSLLNQTFKPDKLILWLGEDKFPNKEKDLPQKLLDLRNNGLTIMWCKDIRSYTKIIPSLKSFPNDIIVTADDDIFYPKNWLKLLYNDYKKHPNEIICHRAHTVQLDKNGNILPYNTWTKAIRHTGSSYRNFLTGVGGVLYPPNSLHSDVTNSALFLELCPYADDVWLYAMALHNGTKIRLVKHNLYRLTYTNLQRELGNTNDTTLLKINVFQNQNDLQIKKIIDFYPDILEKIKDDIINIVCITDNNYVMPTSVLLTSIKLNKAKNKFYQIFIIGDRLTEFNKNVLEQLNDCFFNINFIDYQNKFEHFSKPNFHVSTSALAKFNIMNLLPNLNKVLYLDSDIIVQKNLDDLYNINLEDAYCAVVKDMIPVILYKPSILKKLNLNHEHYFNSGVMLLNLDKLRHDDLSTKLIDYKRTGINYFMDQDALNCCFKENVKYISLKYNYLITLQQRFSPNKIKEYYKMQNLRIKDFSIIHFTSPKKPWESYIPFATRLFYKYYKKSPFKNIKNPILCEYKLLVDFVLQNYIFSTKDAYSKNKCHKVIHFLGIKFSFRNKKMEKIQTKEEAMIEIVTCKELANQGE